MICVEGYKAFRGRIRVAPKCSVKPFEVEGDFLYIPQNRCWYGNGASFGEDIVSILCDFDCTETEGGRENECS